MCFLWTTNIDYLPVRGAIFIKYINVADLKTLLNLMGTEEIKGNELTGDFNGDGKVV